MRFNSHTSSRNIHSIPICFAFDGTNIYAHRANPDAQRWKNVEKNDAVSVEMDHYVDDWSDLKGVMIYGKASFLDSGPEQKKAVSLLKQKYSQYQQRLSDSVVVVKVAPTRVISWGALSK